MSDTHDASTCDAFPLAVGLAQVQARYAKLEALADRLAEALGKATDGWDDAALDQIGARDALWSHAAYQIDG